MACNRDNEVVQAAMKSAYEKTRGVASKNSTSRATQLKAMRAAKTAKREAEQRISEQQQEVEVMRGHLKGSLKRKSEAFEEKDVSLSFRFNLVGNHHRQLLSLCPRMYSKRHPSALFEVANLCYPSGMLQTSLLPCASRPHTYVGCFG